jgi:hypothetical protein
MHLVGFIIRNPKKVSYITEISPMGAALIHGACRRTDELTVLPFQSKRAHLRRFNVAGSNGMYLRLRVKCVIFLPT